jgi:hypothetical protein
VVPEDVATLGISLSWEVALEEAPSTAAREFLDLAGRPEELPPALKRIMDEAAEVVADELPSSPIVRWVLTTANPRLKQDHELHLKLLRFEVQLASITEQIFSPKIKLRAFLSPVGSAEQLLTSAFTVTSARVVRGQGEKRPLDLSAFYSEVAAALRTEIEATQAR